MIEDDDLPSRATTPRPPVSEGQDGSASEGQQVFQQDATSSERDGASEDKSSGKAPESVGNGELSQDVQLKLRKLQKLEGRYHGMQRAFSSVRERLEQS